MKILFLTTAHNSLSQRLFIELTERGHAVVVALAQSGAAMTSAVSQHAPELIVAPMLTIAIPEAIWSTHTCLVVHPGVKGDRGPSSLDWAIAAGVGRWGVTVIEAAAEFDAGPIWAAHTFPLATSRAKSSVYREEITDAAVRAVVEAVAKYETKQFEPETLDYRKVDVCGRLRAPMRQCDRAIDWAVDTTEVVALKVRAADGHPGVLDTVLGKEYFLYGAHEEDRIKGAPGMILAQRDGAICRGTVDGAVWITHLKAKEDPGVLAGGCPGDLHGPDAGAPAIGPKVAGIKLPAVRALGHLAGSIPKSNLPIGRADDHRTFRELRYQERRQVGYLYFNFYNGAMSSEQCYRLRDAFLHARSRPTRVIALLGGRDFFSNGIHLNMIEAAPDPAAESWRNINAMNDLICEILNTMSHVVIAALRGNAGAGGAMLALAADRVYARRGIVLNPHYKGMGKLYGSEYWTYTLPRRVGSARAVELTEACQPVGATAAKTMGFVDDVFGGGPGDFEAELALRAEALAQSGSFCQVLRGKHETRLSEECRKPLADYRAEELARMWINFFGPDPAYHRARSRFVYKGKAPAPSVETTGRRIRFASELLRESG